jgi:hypothetical protein
MEFHKFFQRSSSRFIHPNAKNLSLRFLSHPIFV